MRHCASFQPTITAGQWRPGPVTPSEVQREPVPEFIDPLDCLLAVWIAEAIIESPAGAGEGENPTSVWFSRASGLER
jgi:hypothetical protein